MSRSQIGQDQFGLSECNYRRLSLDGLPNLIDWFAIDQRLPGIFSASKGEPVWPPFALFKSLVLAVYYDLADVKLAKSHDECGSFRDISGSSELAQPLHRSGFVRFRKALSTRRLTKNCSIN